MSLTFISKGEFIKSIYLDLFQKNFLSFSFPILSNFSHTSLSLSLLYSSSRILVVRVFVGDQEKRSPSFQFVFEESCRGYGLGKLAGSRCLEFLRELIVEIAASASLRDRVCCSCGNK